MGVNTGKAAIPANRGQNILSFQGQSLALSSKAIANKEVTKTKVRPSDTKECLNMILSKKKKEFHRWKQDLEMKLRN